VSVPQRIVCLCPSITEALFAIGAGERVVGVTEYCVHPRERVADLPKVGGSKVADLDALFALKPDLVVMNEEENRLEDYEEIAGRGIPVLNTFPKTVADAASMMREVGRSVGCPEEGERVAREIESALATARAAANGKPRVRVACLVWMRPFMAMNRDTFLHDLLHVAGFENAFGGRPERYPRIDKEDLRTGLDAILLPNEPFEFVPQHATEIAAIAGLPTRRAVLCDGQFLSWYGSRTPGGLAYASRLCEQVRAL
jgi:ABC-type Fe3+-hydroxamate transport system substrate-binding protein